jgi:hypothetical protein
MIILMWKIYAAISHKSRIKIYDPHLHADRTSTGLNFCTEDVPVLVSIFNYEPECVLRLLRVVFPGLIKTCLQF